MTWFDFLLMAFLASLIVLGIKRQLGGLLVGVGAVLIFRIFVAMSTTEIKAVAIAFALIAGLFLGLFGLRLNKAVNAPEILKNILGGIGGALVGVLMLLSIVTSLPLGKNINQQYVYPSLNLKPVVRSALQESYFVDIGRNILLYPLLENNKQLTGSSAQIYKVLHKFIVIGKPWERL